MFDDLALFSPHSVVEFKMEDSMKKAVEVLNKHSLSGRPLKVKEVSEDCYNAMYMCLLGML